MRSIHCLTRVRAMKPMIQWERSEMGPVLYSRGYDVATDVATTKKRSSVRQAHRAKGALPHYRGDDQVTGSKEIRIRRQLIFSGATESCHRILDITAMRSAATHF